MTTLLLNSVGIKVEKPVLHQLVKEAIKKQVLFNHHSDFLLSVTTIMKTVIGAGILALPLTVSRLGFGLSLAVFAFIIASDQFTCLLLLKCKNLSRHSNYTSIIYHIFRNKLIQGICSFSILINNIGICIAELTLFKGALRKILYFYVSEDAFNSFYTQGYFIVLILAAL